MSKLINNLHSWPFQVAHCDLETMEHRLHAPQGFAGINLVILGPPQCPERGIDQETLGLPIRSLVPIIEISQAMEIMQACSLGMPNPVIMAPVEINAWANGGNPEQNRQTAVGYTTIAQTYIQKFHPDLPMPNLITDKLPGVETIALVAPQIIANLPQEILDELTKMAAAHTQQSPQNIEETTMRVAGYLAAHFPAYGQLAMPDYISPGVEPALYIVPQSEARFHHMMQNGGREAIISAGLGEPKLPDHDNNIIAYSHTLNSPHYYCHQGEPTLGMARTRWPTRNQLSRIPGLNGLARDEISAAIGLIETDIGGRQNVPELQKVLKVLISICQLSSI